MSAIRLIHLADLHIGYTGPTSQTLTTQENTQHAGRYIREVDIENAAHALTKAIINAQPEVDIVLIAGDIFHKPTPSPRAITCITRMMNILTRQGIAVVIINGNHDTSHVLHTGNPLTFLKALGVQVVNGDTPRILRDNDWNLEHITPDRRAKLAQLAVHAIPYTAMDEHANLTHMHHLEGYINVLLAHGRVSKMDELNSLHKKALTIPDAIFNAAWDYIALGDWHIHRHQPLAHKPAYYAGSLEALNFGEATNHPRKASEAYAVHGAIDVHLEHGKPVEIHTLPNTQARPLLRLKSIDASQMDADMLIGEIRKRFPPDLPAHAFATLDITDIHPEAWNQLNYTEITRLRKCVRYCTIVPTFQRIAATASAEALSEAAIDQQWEKFLEEHEKDITKRAWYKDAGLKKIEEAQQMILAASLEEGE